MIKGDNSFYSSISALEDWDFVTPVEIPQYKIGNFLYKNSFLGNLTGTTSLIKGHNSLYLSVSALEDWAYVIGVNEKLQRKILGVDLIVFKIVRPLPPPQKGSAVFLNIGPAQQQPRHWGSPFNFSESGRGSGGGGTAITY